jgi:hypothetical protein
VFENTILLPGASTITRYVANNVKSVLNRPYTKATIGNMLLATFLVMLPVITEHVANCCLDEKPLLYVPTSFLRQVVF